MYGYRVSRPVKFTDLKDPAQMTQLNEIITALWNVTNGRYNFDITTSNPDGSLSSEAGRAIILYTGGNYYLEINVDGSTTWLGVQLTDLP